MPSLLLSRGAVEPAWEVVDHQEISPVPTYFDDQELQVISVASEYVSRTYTFNAPSSSPKPAPSPNQSRPAPPKRQHSVFSILKRRKAHPKHERRTQHARIPSSSSGSTYSYPCPIRALFSDDDDTSSASSASSSSCSGSEHEVDIHPEKRRISMREALVFARQQLLASSEVKKMGADVLSSEGWSVTRLRRGTDQHRLQVRYFGRPARVELLSPSDSIPSSLPPFLEMLEGSWY